MKIDLVCSGMQPDKIRLQPRRYIHEFCKHAQQMGVGVRVLSDGHPRLPQTDCVEGVPVYRLDSVGFPVLSGNPSLEAAIQAGEPDALIWHVGTTSALHLDLAHDFHVPKLALFTSPIYHPRDLLAVGPSGMALESMRVIVPAIGSITPALLVRRLLADPALRAVIVLSHHTRAALVRRGLSPQKVFVVPPGVDRAWLDGARNGAERSSARRSLGLADGDFAVAYFGAPDFYRGSDTLLHAVARAAPHLRHLKLLIFSRRREGELSAGQARLDRLIHKLGLQDRTRLISTFLDQTELIRLVGAADAVALPFKLVSAEAPLGVFEAMALGKPVIATRVDGLPELLAAGRGVLVPPADPAGLAEALQRLACDPDAISMMAQKARDFVSARGGWPQVARDILDVIRRSV